MSTSQDDLERQFQADMERAAALSMESLALEEFKRKQHYGRTSSSSSASDQLAFAKRASAGISEQQQERRRSDINRGAVPPTTSSVSAPDLISFSGPDPNPDSKSGSPQPSHTPSPVPDKHTSFVQYVDQIHQMTAHQQQYLSRMPTTSSAIIPFGRAPIPVPIGGPSGMQLMPYSPTVPPQNQPLTPDNLQKLYNSPYVPTNSPGYAPRYPHVQPPHQVYTQKAAAVPFPGLYHAPVVNQPQVIGIGPLSAGNKIHFSL